MVWYEGMIVPFGICVIMLLATYIYYIQFEEICSEEYVYSKYCYVCDETNSSCLRGEVENNKCKTGFLFDVEFHNEYNQDKWLSSEYEKCKMISK
jgi:hypothetical protein